MIITGGTGNGFSAGVSSENMLRVEGVSASVEHHVNFDHGQAYAMQVNVTPAAGGDNCFAYILNSDTKNMSIEGIRLWLAQSEYIDVKLGDIGTPGGAPTAVVPSNQNAGSGNIATGTFYQDPDITNLTTGIVTDRIYHATSPASTLYNFPQDIIVPTNQACTFYAQTGAVALYMVVYFWYHVGE